MKPFDRIVAGLAAQPEGARRRRFDPPFKPNAELDRLLADPALRERVLTPSLRMELGMYQQQKQAYEAQQGKEQAL